ncbi:MAG: extracellular solute-binding protein [Prochlorothrix sp.]
MTLTPRFNRRSFLAGSAALGLNTLLSSCGASPRPFKVRLLKGSMPVQMVGAYRTLSAHNTTAPLDVIPEAQVSQLFRLLQNWAVGDEGNPPTGLGRLWPLRQPDTVADLVSLGDAWLPAAIRQDLIQPFPAVEAEAQWLSWNWMPEFWKALGRRDAQGFPSPDGDLWAVPYRWGSTVIAYRQDQCRKWGWEPQDWDDLWRDEVRDRLVLPDLAREVIGLTLKSLGRSYNDLNPSQVPELAVKLAQLQRQVKFYSSDTYLQPLLLGDATIAVGWSTDLLPLLAYDRKIRLVFPPSGPALWADLWVHPRTASGETAAMNEWINFCWDAKIAPKFAELGQGTSPLGLGVDPSTVSNHHILVPDRDRFDRSEFINPLPPAALAQYQDLWQRMRQGSLG